MGWACSHAVVSPEDEGEGMTSSKPDEEGVGETWTEKEVGEGVELGAG